MLGNNLPVNPPQLPEENLPVGASHHAITRINCTLSLPMNMLSTPVFGDFQRYYCKCCSKCLKSGDKRNDPSDRCLVITFRSTLLSCPKRIFQSVPPTMQSPGSTASYHYLRVCCQPLFEGIFKKGLLTANFPPVRSENLR